MSERSQLIGIAYRLLGSLAEAEDVVQETCARWYAMSQQQREDIGSPRGRLTKVASRICLDLLGSARARRESYVGEWIAEPVPERMEWSGGRRPLRGRPRRRLDRLPPRRRHRRHRLQRLPRHGRHHDHRSRRP
ncbi:MAG TPA: sigma factor [Nonomuraea sp.]|nr:sigma factor [Nonomuraea sp.]